MIKYLLVRDSEITVLGGFWVLKPGQSLWHADVNLVSDPAFQAGVWTALRKEWDPFKHVWFCESALGKTCCDRIWGALGMLEHWNQHGQCFLVVFLIQVAGIPCQFRISRSTCGQCHANRCCFAPRFPPGVCGSCSVGDTPLTAKHISERGCILSVMWPLKAD